MYVVLSVDVHRDTVQQTNNRLLQLLSDSVHTYVEVEDTINRRLHSVVNASLSSARSHSPALAEFATPKGAGTTSFSSVGGGERGAVGGSAVNTSPTQSENSSRHRELLIGICLIFSSALLWK